MPAQKKTSAAGVGRVHFGQRSSRQINVMRDSIESHGSKAPSTTNLKILPKPPPGPGPEQDHQVSKRFKAISQSFAHQGSKPDLLSPPGSPRIRSTERHPPLVGDNLSLKGDDSKKPLTDTPSSKSIAQLLLQGVKLTEDDTNYLVNTSFNNNEGDYANADEFVKTGVLIMMFTATLSWGIFFYWHRDMPKALHAYREIEKIFVPKNNWSNILFLICCPWVAGLYCLIISIYPDPRKWRFCIKPRREVRWVPYILILLYTTVVITHWFYQLAFVPANIRRKLKRDLVNFDSKWPKQKLPNGHYDVELFPAPWKLIHNYYQCCGIETKLDWRNKIIPFPEKPFPYNDPLYNCMTLKYGLFNYDSTAKANCPPGSFKGVNVTELGVMWPASCCNNMTASCINLPRNNEIWRSHCLNSEVWLTMNVVLAPLFLTVIIVIVGVRIMESISMERKSEYRRTHF